MVSDISEKLDNLCEKLNNLIQANNKYKSNEATSNAPYSDRIQYILMNINYICKKESLIDSIIFEHDYIPIIKPEDVEDGFSVEQLETLIRDRKDAIDYYRQNPSTASEDTLKNQAANYLDAKKGFNKASDDFSEYKKH